MSIYDPLRDKLKIAKEQALTISFFQIDEILGRPLPQSAYDYDAWWSNEDPDKTTHSQCVAWISAGYEAEVNRKAQTVTFRRK